MDNRRKKQLMLLALLLGCFITSLLNTNKDFKELEQDSKAVVVKPAAEKNNKIIKPAKKVKEIKDRITIQISGAVLQPGIYSLPLNSSVEEALLMAGGLTPEANTEKLNYAKKLKDGGMLYVPSKKFVRSKAEVRNTKSSGEENLRVNLNTATQQELERLPGIGPAMAVKILSRRQLKPFGRVEELMEVSGIGKAKLAKLKPYITL